MPLHDYQCPVCGEILPDQYRSIEDGALARLPLCFACQAEMVWIPQIGAMDAYEPGQEFQVYDGQNRLRTVESLRGIRQIEKESEQQARNGEGQRMVWRRYSQDRSNLHVNTLGPDPSERPSEEGKRKFGLRRSAVAPQTTYGPGVTDSNTSALKE